MTLSQLQPWPPMTPPKIVRWAFGGLLICGLTACEIEPVASLPASPIPAQSASTSTASTSTLSSPPTETALPADDDVKEDVAEIVLESVQTTQIETSDNSSFSVPSMTITQDVIPETSEIVAPVSDPYGQYDNISAEVSETPDSQPSEITEIVNKVQSDPELNPAPVFTSETTEIAALIQTPAVPPKPEIEIPKAAPIIAPKPEPARIVTAIPAAPPKPPAPPAQLQPASLVGLTVKSLIAEIGDADFVRLEGQMQIWQYKTANCVTDFFLYPATDIAAPPTYLVTDWYSRARAFGSRVNPKTCREELATRQAF